MTPEKKRILIADLSMLLTALIWGGGIVAQRAAAGTLPPLLYTGLRFGLGALVLVPFLPRDGEFQRTLVKSGPSILLVGTLLTLSIALQQLGLQTTEAGKTGFLTSVYLVLVPVLGLAVGMRTTLSAWLAVLLTAIGTFVLCSGAANASTLRLAPGDVLVLGCAVFSAIHLLAITRYTVRMSSMVLAFSQFAVCAFFCLTLSYFFEPQRWSDIRRTALPILYGGIPSVGLGYTIQVMAQRYSPPTHAAVLLGMESVFAVLIGGWLLGENLSARAAVGCALILVAVLLVQLGGRAQPVVNGQRK